MGWGRATGDGMRKCVEQQPLADWGTTAPPTTPAPQSPPDQHEPVRATNYVDQQDQLDQHWHVPLPRWTRHHHPCACWHSFGWHRPTSKCERKYAVVGIFGMWQSVLQQKFSPDSSMMVIFIFTIIFSIKMRGTIISKWQDWRFGATIDAGGKSAWTWST